MLYDLGMKIIDYLTSKKAKPLVYLAAWAATFGFAFYLIENNHLVAIWALLPFIILFQTLALASADDPVFKYGDKEVDD